jgi:PKD repeat protein
MKNLNSFILLLMLTFSASVFSQSIQRNVVVLEIGTGTWCQYCPGASNAADQMIAEGKSVAVIENHNGDIYANTYSNTRNSYYSISGYPTGKFDGTLTYEGGLPCPTGNVYGDYMSLYEQRIAAPSPVNICFSGTHVGNSYTIQVSVDKLSAITATDLRLHLVLTESDIAENWQGCMTEVNFVNRLMVPSVNGTSFSFSSGDNFSTSLTFDVDPTWVASNCELVAFVQNYSSKEIYNGVKSSLNSLPSALFSLNDYTGSPNSGCIPLQVNFSTTQSPAASLTWNFPGGNPSTSNVTNPAVTYTETGTYSVVLTGTDGVCLDQITKTDYITTRTVPAAPGQVQGNANLCINPPGTSYSISAVTGADSYLWELDPSNAGILSPTGTSCSIDWDNTWTGVAHLKAQAISTLCGPGAWSPALNININPIPGQCSAPSGPTTMCQDSPDTDYSTTISPAPSSFYWNLDPPTAGFAMQGAQTTTIDWESGFSGTVVLTVSAMNGICEGPVSEPITIHIIGQPTTYNVTGGGVYCGIGGTGSEVNLDGSQIGANYTLYLNGTATGSPVAGTGSPISFGNQMAAGNYTVGAEEISSSCTSLMNGLATVSVDPQAPQQPADPDGPSLVYTKQTSTTDYSTSGGTYSTTYTWELTPSEAGTVSGISETGTVTWNPLYVGIANLKVQGVNSCGGGTFSNNFPVDVEMNVGIPENLKEKEFSVSPNPASKFLNISGPENTLTEITILNSIGSALLHQECQFTDGNLRLDIQSLTPGVYFIRFSNLTNSQLTRLIVK